MTPISRIGYLDANQIAAAVSGTGTVQASSDVLTALAGLPGTVGVIQQVSAGAFAIRLIGAANDTDLLTRADGDARYARILPTYPGPYATDADAGAGGVASGHLYTRSDGSGGLYLMVKS